MKDAIGRLFRYYFSTTLWVAVRSAESLPVPTGLRRLVHARWGLEQADAVVERGARFTNRYVSLGSGAVIGRKVCFEGGAPIVVMPGVEINGPVLVTTKVDASGQLTHDRPVLIEQSISAEKKIVVSPGRNDHDGC